MALCSRTRGRLESEVGDPALGGRRRHCLGRMGARGRQAEPRDCAPSPHRSVGCSGCFRSVLPSEWITDSFPSPPPTSVSAPNRKAPVPGSLGEMLTWTRFFALTVCFLFNSCALYIFKEDFIVVFIYKSCICPPKSPVLWFGMH